MREPARTGSTSEGMTAAKKTNLWYLPALAALVEMPSACYRPFGAPPPATERFRVFLYLNVRAL
jgi:hypothetical protein